MKNKFRNTTLSIAIAAGLAGAVWAPASHACATEPYIGSICATAFNFASGWGDGVYYRADGAILPIANFHALFSLIGSAFGGDGRVNFALPDLRGRVIVGMGSGPGLEPIQWTQLGGFNWSQLSTNNLPVHNHGLSTAMVNTSRLAVNTTMTGLNATANLAGVKVSGAASGLQINVSSTSGGSTAPSSSSYLGKAGGTMGAIYTTTTPDTTLNPGSISGSLSMTIANGTTAPVTVTGSPSSTLTGTATLSGGTDNAGAGTAFSNMQPFLGLNYYIAVDGAFPPRQ